MRSSIADTYYGRVVIIMQSVFTKTYEMPRFAPLADDATARVLVIGGGIAGILTARLLADAGVDVLLCEAERLCSGQTGNTTAKITVAPGFLYADLLRRGGKEAAKMFYQAQTAALQQYRRMAGRIDCDFETQPFFAYAAADHRALGQELAALSEIGAKARFVSRPDLPFETVGAICLPDQAQFHPLRFLGGLVKDLRICEKTPIRSVFKGGAETASGHLIWADHIVIATHFPFLRLHGAFAVKMHQERSYVLALEQTGFDGGGMWADGLGKGVSMRYFKDQLLLGGAGHRTGVRGGGYEVLRQLAEQYFPGSHVAARYAAQDCMTLDGVPYIGAFTARDARLYAITGFGKWGMCSSMVGAMLIRDMVIERKSPWAEVFAPWRPMAPLPLLKNIGAVLKHYLRPTAPRCNHLGSALRWNAQERSWDCPCHGSRFSESGELIDAPALHDLRSRKVK